MGKPIAIVCELCERPELLRLGALPLSVVRRAGHDVPDVTRYEGFVCEHCVSALIAKRSAEIEAGASDPPTAYGGAPPR